MRTWQTILAGMTTVVLALAAAASAGLAAAQDAKQLAYGQHLSQECTGCHRIDGIDNGIPSIVGWSPDAFTQTLGFYQTGKRTNPVMISVATSLNDKQVEALAAYFGSLPKPTPKAAPKAAPKGGKK
jgi:cytochrome c553